MFQSTRMRCHHDVTVNKDVHLIIKHWNSISFNHHRCGFLTPRNMWWGFNSTNKQLRWRLRHERKEQGPPSPVSPLGTTWTRQVVSGTDMKEDSTTLWKPSFSYGLSMVFLCKQASFALCPQCVPSEFLSPSLGFVGPQRKPNRLGKSRLISHPST